VSGDQARISVSVSVPIEAAFEIFTTEIDSWWRRGPKFRHAGLRTGLVCLEPGVGGRLFESIDDQPTPRVFEVGRVSVWDPPRRVVFSWRNATFAPHEQTEVEVQFAPTTSGTMVTVTHRGLASLRDDHPARHGQLGAAFSRMIGLWWGDQMTSLRELCRQRRRN
jgi:uncharacterized protein YndB with AHSA1/START domain